VLLRDVPLEFLEIFRRNGETRGALGLSRVEELARTTLLEHVTGVDVPTHSRSVCCGDVFGEVASWKGGISVAILVPAPISASISTVTVTIVPAPVPAPVSASISISTATAAAVTAATVTSVAASTGLLLQLLVFLPELLQQLRFRVLSGGGRGGWGGWGRGLLPGRLRPHPHV